MGELLGHHRLHTGEGVRGRLGGRHRPKGRYKIVAPNKQGADTVIDFGNGARMTLQNVNLSSLDPGWIVG